MARLPLIDWPDALAVDATPRSVAGYLMRFRDADTPELLIGTEYEGVAVVPIRLLDTRSPERHTPEGREALAFIATLVSKWQQCRIVPFAPRGALVKTFDRFVGRVETIIGDQVVDLGALLREQHYGLTLMESQTGQIDERPYETVLLSQIAY